VYLACEPHLEDILARLKLDVCAPPNLLVKHNELTGVYLKHASRPGNLDKHAGANNRHALDRTDITHALKKT
jgi:hypothetical protein